jgi:hypothetical protein
MAYGSMRLITEKIIQGCQPARQSHAQQAGPSWKSPRRLALALSPMVSAQEWREASRMIDATWRAGLMCGLGLCRAGGARLESRAG